LTTGTGGTITVNSGVQLTVTTNVNAPVSGTALAGNVKYTLAGAGTISCVNVNCNNTTVPPNGGAQYTRFDTLKSTIAALNISSNLVLNGTAANSTRVINPVFNLQSGTVTVNGLVTSVNSDPNNVATLDMVVSAASPTLILTKTNNPFSPSGTGTTTNACNGSNATVNYGASGPQTVENLSYTNLSITGSNTKTVSAALAIPGTLNIASGCSLDMATFALSGALTTLSGAGTLKSQATTTPIPSGKSWPFAVEYNNATGGQTIVAGTYASLINSNTSGTNTASAISMNGALTMNASSLLNMGSNAMTGTLTSVTGAGKLTTQNTSATPLPASATWSGTVEYNNATGGQTIVAGTYNNLTNSNTSNTNTAGGALSVNGILTMNTSSVLNMGTNAMSGTPTSVTGTGILRTQNTSATPLPSSTTWSGTVEYNNATGSQTVVQGTYSSLTNSNTSGSNAAGGALTVNDSLTLNPSSVLDMGVNALSGTLIKLKSTGSLKTQNTSATPIPTGKSWPFSIEYNNATGGQTVVAGTYASLTNSNTTGINTAAAITVNSALTLNASSVLSMGTNALIGTLTTLSGTGTLQTQNSSATPVPTGRTWPFAIEYNNASGGQTVVAGTYASLINSNTSGVNTAAVFTVNGTLTLNASSVLNMGTNPLIGTLTTLSGTGTLRTQNTTSTPVPTGRTWPFAIEYNNATGGQTIVAGTYASLINSNTSGTNTASAITVNGALTMNASSLMNMGTNAMSGTLTSVTGTGVLKTQNSTTTPLPASATWSGTVEYNNGTGSQRIVAGSYNNLTISNTSGSNTTGGNISVTGATLLNVSSVLNLSGTGTNSVNSLSLQSGASLSVGTAALQIAGAVSGTGTISAATGGIEMNGTSAQSIPASLFTGNAVKDLTTNNNSGVTLGGTLNVIGVLKATAGSFNTGTFLTLVSSATQTALIDGSGLGNVLGTVNMQRYLPSGFGYRYISSPCQSATVAELSDDVNLSASFPEVYRYDESLSYAGWVNYTNASGMLNSLEGYAVNFGATTAAKTIDITGVVNNGTVSSATLYNHNQPYTQGFNLAGNPYPSPIDWTATSGWSRTNIDNAIYYFNNGIADRYQGTYSSYINGVSSDGIASNIIPSMQGFFIHVSNGTYPVTASMSVNNDVRVNNLSPVFHKETGSKDNPLVRISAGYANQNGLSDPAVVYFENGSTSGYDRELDALKMLNTDERVPSLYSMAGDSKLSINGVPEPLNDEHVIPLGLEVSKDGQVNIEARDVERMPTGLHLYFADASTGVIQDLEQEASYLVLLSKGSYQRRFYLIFSNQKPVAVPGLNGLNAFAKGSSIFVNVTDGGTLQIFNMLGQVVGQEEIKQNGLHEFPLQSAAGVYIVRLSSGNAIQTQKVFLGN
jgi:hypothetical protein